MTPLPKRRWSTQRQGRKRATIKAAKKRLIKCLSCGSLKENHAVCPSCGTYKGIEVIKIKSKSHKKDKSTPEG